MASNSDVGLQEALGLFRVHEKTFIRSAYSRVTERKLLEWSESKQLRLLYRKQELAAALVFETPSHRRPIKDFSGHVRSEIEAGDLYVKRLACKPGCEHLVTKMLLAEKAQGRRV